MTIAAIIAAGWIVLSLLISLAISGGIRDADRKESGR